MNLVKYDYSWSWYQFIEGFWKTRMLPLFSKPNYDINHLKWQTDFSSETCLYRYLQNRVELMLSEYPTKGS